MFRQVTVWGFRMNLNGRSSSRGKIERIDMDQVDGWEDMVNSEAMQVIRMSNEMDLLKENIELGDFQDTQTAVERLVDYQDRAPGDAAARLKAAELFKANLLKGLGSQVNKRYASSSSFDCGQRHDWTEHHKRIAALTAAQCYYGDGEGPSEGAGKYDLGNKDVLALLDVKSEDDAVSMIKEMFNDLPPFVQHGLPVDLPSDLLMVEEPPESNVKKGKRATAGATAKKQKKKKKKTEPIHSDSEDGVRMQIVVGGKQLSRWTKGIWNEMSKQEKELYISSRNVSGVWPAEIPDEDRPPGILVIFVKQLLNNFVKQPDSDIERTGARKSKLSCMVVERSSFSMSERSAEQQDLAAKMSATNEELKEENAALREIAKGLLTKYNGVVERFARTRKDHQNDMHVLKEKLKHLARAAKSNGMCPVVVEGLSDIPDLVRSETHDEMMEGDYVEVRVGLLKGGERRKLYSSSSRSDMGGASSRVDSI